MPFPEDSRAVRLSRRSLYTAVENGRNRDVETLLLKGTPVDTRNKIERTALHVAAATGSKEMVKLLLSFGAQVTDCDYQQKTPLHFAAGSGNLEVVKELIKAPSINGGPININAKDSKQETPLHVAALKGQSCLIKYFIECGAQIDVQKEDGVTPLHLAAAARNSEAVVELLHSGAQANSVTSNGFTPLHCAVLDIWYLEQKVICKKLLPRKLDKEQILKQEKVISILLNGRADPNVLSYESRTPVDHYFGISNTVLGKTALHIAAGNNSSEIVRILLDGGANINSQDAYGRTIFHSFCSMHNSILALLMELFVDLNIFDEKGKTPLHYSQKYQHRQVDYYQTYSLGLVKLIVKMESDGKLKINNQNRHILSKLHPQIELECRTELQILKERKVCGNTRFYDLLCHSINKLAALIRNKELLKTLDSGVCEEFPIYGRLIEIRMKMAFQRNKVLEESLEVLTNLISSKNRPKLPRFVGLEVLYYLNVADLESLSHAW